MIRLGTINDLDDCYNIVLDAKEFMKQTGSLQWQQGYPYKENIEKDLLSKTMYVYDDGGIIKGMIALRQEFTKNYVDITGAWVYPPSDDDLVVHRLAVKKEYRGMGIAKELMAFAIDYARKNNIHHLKTDTHPLNIAMQRTAEGAGFVRRGTVISMLEKLDGLRYAYELILE